MAALLALLAAVSWGSSDFLAGNASRRSSAVSVVILTHLASVVALVLVAVDFGPVWSTLSDLASGGGDDGVQWSAPRIVGTPSSTDIAWGLGRRARRRPRRDAAVPRARQGFDGGGGARHRRRRGDHPRRRPAWQPATRSARWHSPASLWPSSPSSWCRSSPPTMPCPTPVRPTPARPPTRTGQTSRSRCRQGGSKSSGASTTSPPGASRAAGCPLPWPPVAWRCLRPWLRPRSAPCKKSWPNRPRAIAPRSPWARPSASRSPRPRSTTRSRTLLRAIAALLLALVGAAVWIGIGTIADIDGQLPAAQIGALALGALMLAASAIAAWAILPLLRSAPVAAVAAGTGTVDAADATATSERRALRSVLSQPGLPEALLSGVGFGLFFVFIYRTSESAGQWPLLGARSVSVVMFTIAALVTSTSVLPAAGSRLAVVWAGLFDAIAAILFVVATRAGSLSVAAVLASLYPAITVLLARVVTKEQIRPIQVAGLALALGAVGLLAI